MLAHGNNMRLYCFSFFSWEHWLYITLHTTDKRFSPHSPLLSTVLSLELLSSQSLATSSCTFWILLTPCFLCKWISDWIFFVMVSVLCSCPVLTLCSLHVILPCFRYFVHACSPSCSCSGLPLILLFSLVRFFFFFSVLVVFPSWGLIFCCIFFCIAVCFCLNCFKTLFTSVSSVLSCLGSTIL